MSLRHITMLVVGVTFLALVIYDSYAASKANEDTITVVMRDAGKYAAVLPLAWGVLTTHLFAQSPILLGIGLLCGCAWNPVGEWVVSKITFWKR